MIRTLLRRLRNNNAASSGDGNDLALKVPQLFIDGDTCNFETVVPIGRLAEGSSLTELQAELDTATMERALEEYISSDVLPLPMPADREGYFGDRHDLYWLSGLKDYLLIKAALARHGCPVQRDARILDLGCASGRVLRHFAVHEPALEVWGADINLRHVEWIRRFLGKGIKVIPNTVLPQLPVEDNALSLVCAFSVFTHIDELELAWIAELRRIIRKGGFAYLTIHSDDTWNRIETARPLYDDLLALAGAISDYDVSPELFRKPMPREKTVFKWSEGIAYNSNVFHSTKYVEDTWGAFFEVAEIIRRGHNYQDVVILKKK